MNRWRSGIRLRNGLALAIAGIAQLQAALLLTATIGSEFELSCKPRQSRFVDEICKGCIVTPCSDGSS